jgi:predicted dithiol-disulfide oxidoreductase (DUF899 family)
MTKHPVVNHEEWEKQRKAFLKKEREFTHLRDKLTKERQNLPWERVEKNYVFETSKGKKSLSDLFEGRHQLLIYHFMYGPDWDEGCKSCSFWADNFERNVIHLAHRDITMIAVSRAPVKALEDYKKRLGWTFTWASSLGNDFNHDYHVSFKPSELNNVYYNYENSSFPSEEAPGLSAFYRDDEGNIYHTYSTYARGLDMCNTGYQLMDLAPMGRNEEGLEFTMEWLKRRDEY